MTFKDEVVELQLDDHRIVFEFDGECIFVTILAREWRKPYERTVVERSLVLEDDMRELAETLLSWKRYWKKEGGEE